jgi:hypothetical protein
MAIRTERFAINEHEIRAVIRSDSSWIERLEEGARTEHHSFFIEVYFYDGGNATLEFEDDKAERDRMFDVLAGYVP